MLRPLTDPEVVATYGDPSHFLGEDGNIDSAWKLAILDGFQLPAPLPLSWDRTKVARRVTCHRLVVKELSSIFAELYKDQEAWASINDYGGCYMWRTNRNNPKKRSRHCWGIAVDFDCADNENGDRTPEMHPRIIETFERAGWIWGGRFPTPDGMHFERGLHG